MTRRTAKGIGVGIVIAILSSLALWTLVYLMEGCGL